MILSNFLNDLPDIGNSSENDYNPENNITLIDLDNDGTFETVAQGFDTDGDAQLDTWVMQSDIDNDGVADQISLIQGLDTDSDGQIDTWAIQPAYGEQVGTDESVTESNIDGYDASDLTSSQEIGDEANIIDDPASDMEHWHQQTHEDTCAVSCQEFILEEMAGRDFSENELRQEAYDNGWYTPGGGTPLDCMGNLLEAHGIPVEKQEGCTLQDLSDSLAQGENVIVAVDSEEIANPGGMDADDLIANVFGMPGQGANHAVQVIGIDTSDPDNPMVILNDPGTPDGQGMSMPANDFLNAWEDSNYFMVSTANHATPGDSLDPAAASAFGHDAQMLGSYEDAAYYRGKAEYYQQWADSYAKDGNYSTASDYEKWGADALRKAEEAAKEKP